MLTPSIDLNVSLGFWPFQRFLLRTPAALARHMERLGVDHSFVCAAESVLYPDPDVYDEICFDSLAKHPSLHPVKTVNPVLSNWQDSLEAFAERYPIAAIRLYPSYHDYTFDDERLTAVMKTAAKRKLPVLVTLRVEDERQQHSVVNASPPSVPALMALAAAHPRTTVVALNGYSYELFARDDAPKNFFADLAFVERPDTLQAAAESAYSGNWVYGSHTPYFTTESALAKLQTGTASAAFRRRILRNTERVGRLALQR